MSNMNNWLKSLLLVLSSTFALCMDRSPEALINPDLEYDKPVRLSPIDKKVGKFFSYGFFKANWFSGFDVNISIIPTATDEQLLEQLVNVLIDCSKQIAPKVYATETYLPPSEAVFYQILMSQDSGSSYDFKNSNFLRLVDGVVKRFRGINRCTEEEKKALEGKDYGVIWSKPIAEVLKEAKVDPQVLNTDPLLVFNITDDTGVREVILQEMKKIHQIVRSKGYNTVGERLKQTALRNKGQIREWFFEYQRSTDELPLSKKGHYPFDVVALKQEWLELASLILKELNSSKDLDSFRKAPWDLRSLRFNFSIVDRVKFVDQSLYVSWSHCIIELSHRKKNGTVIEHKVIRIPLEEFYQWAEGELAKRKSLENE